MNTMKRSNWLPNVLDEILNGDWIETNNPVRNFGRSTPAVNVKETQDDFIVEVAVPGMKREDFKIELDDNLLSISSKMKEEKETENEEEKYTLKEFSYNSFKRSFTLPESIDSSKIAADYSDGVLKIGLPKREEVKTESKRLIEIG